MLQQKPVFWATYASVSWQPVLGILTGPMARRYLCFHILLTVYSIYGTRYFMVLIYVRYVILVGCTISYREIFFLVNRIWPTLCSPL